MKSWGTSQLSLNKLFEQLPVRGMLRAGCLLMIAVLAYYTVTRAPRVTHGFVAYYTYARMLLEGEDFQKVYDFDFLNAQMRQYGIEGINDVPHNLPTNALLLAPIAWLPPQQAKIALSTVSFCAILASLFLLLRTYGVSIQENLGMVLTILFFTWRPVYDNIYLGQVYAVLLLLFCLSLWGLQKKHGWFLPIPLAFAFLFKGHGVVPLLCLAVRKRWRALLLAFLCIIVVFVATLPMFGIESWTAYYSKVVSTLGTNPTDGGAAYQTINSLVYHLFTYDPQWLPYPLVVLPDFVVKIISYFLNVTLILYVLLACRDTSRSSGTVSFSAALAVGVVTAPLAEEYAFMLFLPFVFGLVITVAEHWNRKQRLVPAEWICLSAIFVLALPLQYKSLHASSFPLFLLAYPKLFAGIATLVCFVRMERFGYLQQAREGPE